MAEIHQLPPRPDFTANKAGTPYATLDNFKRLLRAHGITISYNEISKEIDVDIPHKSYLPDNYLNCCIAELISICNGYKMANNHILKFMLETADQNKVNPVIQWIESKPWDNVSRLEKFYGTLIAKNEEMKETLLKRWMLSAIAGLYEPNGVAAGGMLVLFGKQYLGKTNWFKNLLPLDMRKNIKDGVCLDLRNKDSVLNCLSHWLVELGEIEATFKKSDLASLKAFVTADRDVLRLPYASTASKFPRRTLFFGSIDKKSYLSDPAGNRRFWTIECVGIDHTHGLDMQQIWAEFAAMYHTGEKWMLTSEEVVMLNQENKEFEVLDPIEEKLLKKYRWGGQLVDWKSSTEILMDMGHKNITQSDATRCAMIVRKLNGDQAKRTDKGRLLGLPQENYVSTPGFGFS